MGQPSTLSSFWHGSHHCTRRSEAHGSHVRTQTCTVALQGEEEACLMSSVEKLTTVWMKFSRMRTLLMVLQSVVGSPRSRQMDSRASFTTLGGFGRFFISTRCGLLMLFTAALTQCQNTVSTGPHSKQLQPLATATYAVCSPC